MTSTKPKPWLIFVEKFTAIVYIVLTLGSIPIFDLSVTFGVLLGGALGLANFALLRRIGEKVFQHPERPRFSYFAFSWVKFGLLVGILFFALKIGWFHPVALMIGFSDFVIGIFAGTMLWTFRGRRFESEDDDPQPPASCPEKTTKETIGKKLGDFF